jgi:hypothetical protein
VKKALRIGFVVLSVVILAATLYLLLTPEVSFWLEPQHEELTTPADSLIQRPFGNLLQRLPEWRSVFAFVPHIFG